MKKLATFLFALLCAAGVYAQNNYYFPTTKGTKLNYKYYDGRGNVLKDDFKNERWMRFTVEEVWPQDNGMVINVGVANETIQWLAKNKQTEQIAEYLSYGDVKIVDDNVVWDNMQWVAGVLPEIFAYMQTRKNNEGPPYNVELTAVSCFPCEMTVGDTLPDEEILEAKYVEVLTDEQIEKRRQRMEEAHTMIMNATGGSPVTPFDLSSMNTNCNISAQTRNRKVEAYEPVETPAGSYDCYKISYELVINDKGAFMGGSSVVMRRGSSMEFMQPPPPEAVKFADWISPKIGLVKREKYNNRGKIQEVTILDSITK